MRETWPMRGLGDLTGEETKSRCEPQYGQYWARRRLLSSDKHLVRFPVRRGTPDGCGPRSLDGRTKSRVHEVLGLSGAIPHAYVSPGRAVGSYAGDVHAATLGQRIVQPQVSGDLVELFLGHVGRFRQDDDGHRLLQARCLSLAHCGAGSAFEWFNWTVCSSPEPLAAVRRGASG